MSRVRDALWEMEAPHGPKGPTALAGRLFHETVAGLLHGDWDWTTTLTVENLEDHQKLRQHAYERLLGPRLALYELGLRESGREALWLWRAVKEFCKWFCGVLKAASDRGWIRWDEQTESWLGAGHMISSERPLSRDFHRPAWRAPVRLTGVADAVLWNPLTSQWCCLEFKLGDAAAKADLAQAALYHSLLSERPEAEGALALVRFLPERREFLLEPAQLEPVQARLVDLIGKLAGVTAGPGAAPLETRFDILGGRLIRTLESFGLRASLAREPVVGPAFVRYTLNPGRAVAVRRIIARADDLGVQLGMPTPMVQVEDSRLVVDVPREDRETVSFARVREALPQVDPVQGSARIPLGVDLNNTLRSVNLAEAESPHVLVAGTAGSGKSEWLRTVVAALLLSNTPETLRLVLIDPKRTAFGDLVDSPYLLHAGALLFPPEGSVVDQLDMLIVEMERRYQSFQRAQVDDVVAWRAAAGQPMPWIVCIVDEFADMMADPRERRAMEERVVRLGAKARAAGIHLILATQHPDAKTVTGRLQANLSVRICMRTATWQQSLVALKARGAERLLGKGDLLFSRGDRTLRLQAPYLTEAERRGILIGHRLRGAGS
ncbi:MAG: DNA translocase FtsK [Bryobacteraceae bacterium]|nr:DNA translocase FtsK [Bryobacteraceae bacterium]